MQDQNREPTPCPLCGYSLAGLPEAYRCPECGFAYDEHTRVWRVASSRFRLAHFTLPIVCLVIFVVVLWPIFQGHAGRTFHLAFVAAILLCFGWILRSMARMKEAEEKGRCVAITPRGLFIRDFTTEEWIDWPDLGRFVFSPDFQYVTRRSSVRTTPIPISFTDEEAKASFVKTIEQARTVYLAQHASPSTSAPTAAPSPPDSPQS